MTPEHAIELGNRTAKLITALSRAQGFMEGVAGGFDFEDIDKSRIKEGLLQEADKIGKEISDFNKFLDDRKEHR